MDTSEYDHLEQDPNSQRDGDNLPTYDDLAEQNGPNSRFGRWRGWVEKRAAERYTDISPDQRRRRRERGWGNDIDIPASRSVPAIVNQPATPQPNSLHIRTEYTDTFDTPTPPHSPDPAPQPPLHAFSQRLRPSHLKITNFGSRFLPHSTTPIRCLLPLLGGKLLLIGHDEGLSVIDTYPHEWSDSDAGIIIKGPEDAVSRPIWRGESVSQMTLLEVEESGEGSPQGVVLVLVGPELDSPLSKDETLRTLRMYNLASLTSVAKWAISQRGTHPLDLSSRPNLHPHQSPKRKSHLPQSSLARSLKAWIEQPSGHHHPVEQPASLHTYRLSPASLSASSLGKYPSPDRAQSRSPIPHRHDSDDSTTSWDMVDDLPSRWALDFVPLVSPGSRLANSNVISYALWNNDNHQARGGRLLAIATKANILLYETPKGERAFRFVKEFYTPLQPKSVTFFQQIVHEVGRSPSDAGPSRFVNSHRRSDSAGTMRGERVLTSPTGHLNYGTQLSLFVVFEKKAGWIRLGDSAVGEFELFEDGADCRSRESSSSLVSPSSHRKSRISFDASALLGKWIPMIQCDVPFSGTTKKIHLLTRGRKTHILPCPLPIGIGANRPIRVLLWKSAPSSIHTRVCTNELGDGPSQFLQVVGFGENGIEVYELALTFLTKGKGKERADDSIWVDDACAGGPTGFLCVGGHWDQPHYSPYHPLNRASSAASSSSQWSYDSTATDEIVARMEHEQGMYAWCHKGHEDWRVFWLGGSTTEEDEEGLSAES